ncbi:MAG: hypothetical protein VXX11_03105 [Planctomycetota bacterium]|nr:hypothetical protein [Planctomycetota bacterium]
MSSDPHSNGKGYGSVAYGSDPYGHLDIKRPEMVSVVSDGFYLHVTFSEPIRWDSISLSPDNWTLTATYGVVPEIIDVGTGAGTVSDTVTLAHTGLTLGGLYTLKCGFAQDEAGNTISPSKNKVSFLAKSVAPTAQAYPTGENKVVTQITPYLMAGAEDLANYSITTDYPSLPKIIGADDQTAQTVLYLQGLTSVDYEITFGPAQAILVNTPATLTSHSHMDASGRLTPTSAYRLDMAVRDLPATWSVAVGDGETRITVLFDEGQVIQVYAGGIDTVFTYDWSEVAQVSLLRNPLTGHIALLLDGEPVLSRDLAAVTEPHDAAWNVLASGFGAMLTVDSVSLTASQTMYTTDGNFVHELKAQFLGLDDMAKNRIQVNRGPLTKGWGDATPAGINDVAIRVNGTAVSVADVNPYLGLIYPATPIPKMPVGEIDVEVDYRWFENPQMSFRSLNHMGLVLNKWDQAKNPEVQSETLAVENLGGGSNEGERYPISLGLMRPPRPRPKWISHRHIGFDNTYTASLNSPISLVLNANIYGNRARKGYFQSAQSGRFEGKLGNGWEARGNLYLHEDTDDYTSVTSEIASAIAKPIEMNPVGATVTMVARTEAGLATVINDRLSVGPAIAFHDTKDLRLLAGVVLDGVSHIAMLVGDEIDNADSWQPVYSKTVSFLTGNRIEVLEDDLPELFYEGLKVVVPRGNQSGQYTVLNIEKLSTGNWWLYVTPDFPEDTTKWGGGSAEVYFEAPWQASPFNLQMVGRADNEAIGFAFTGTTSFMSSAAIPSANANALHSYASNGATDLALSERGEVLFGNLVGGLHSRWDFVRYVTVPDDYIISSIGHLHALTLHDAPTDQSEWRKTSVRGTVTLEDDDKMRIRAEGAGDKKVGFEKLDALIPPQAGIEVSARFKAQETTSWGDAGFRFQGPNHDVLFATIPYTDSGMFVAQSVALLGTHSFESQGWEMSGEGVYQFEGSRLRLQKTAYKPLSLTNELQGEGETLSRVMEMRIAFRSSTFNDLNDAGLIFGMDAGDKSVGLIFAESKIALTSDGLTYLAEAEYEWLNGVETDFKVVVDVEVGTVTVHVGGVELCAAPLNAFEDSEHSTRAYVIGFGEPEWDMDLYSFRVREKAPATVKRTLGIWKGGSPDLLSSWELARSEGEIVEMDWSDDVTAMVVIDPNWGASLLRPDLPPPPTYVGSGRPERHDPTGAWATVEWEHLPISRRNVSSVHFGMQNPVSQSNTVWDHFRYRVFIQENESETPPRTAVLNRWNVLSSGEYTGDVTVEHARIKVREHLIHVQEANASAKRVFHVYVNGERVPDESWSFDKSKQVIQLESSFDKYSTAEIAFSPGLPITKTYLLNQPLHDGITTLNEGTPPYLLTQLGMLQRSVSPDPPREDEINDLISEHPDFQAQDPTALVEYDHDSAYSSVDFFQVENGGETDLISSLDDGIAPAKGLAEINLDGRMFVETLAPPPAHPFEQGGGSPGSFLTLGGGAHTMTGMLGGGEVQGAVTWPTAPSRPTASPSLARNRTFWELRESFEDAVPAPSTVELTYVMEDGGPYSRTGPWGGFNSLTPLSLLNGGENADGMVLSGGAALPEPIRTRRSFDEIDGNWKA